MKEELKFKNALYAVLYVASFASICIILACVFGIIITYFFEDARDFTNVIFICCLVIIGIWVLAGFAILGNGTVVITANDIKLCYGKRVRWIMQKEEFEECVYHKMHWYDFLIPISTINALYLQFRVIGKVYSKRHCSLSFKQIQQIQKQFNYNIRIIDTVYEQ